MTSIHRTRATALVVVVTTGVAALLLVLLVPALAYSAPATPRLIYVAPNAQCGVGHEPCFSQPQYAVDAAVDGDTVLVAAGTYDVLFQRDGNTQIAHISKTLTLRGGYTTAYTEPPDPTANLTVLDAHHQGRALYVTGPGHVTVEGVRLTRGDALAGGWYGGNGVFARNATLTMRRCDLDHNGVGMDFWGGGMYIADSTVVLEDSRIADNLDEVGGGLYVIRSAITLTRNVFVGNIAIGSSGGGGGALYLAEAVATMSNNLLIANVAGGQCGGGIAVNGGVSLHAQHTTLVANRGHWPWGFCGGGIHTDPDGNRVVMTNTVAVSHTTAIANRSGDFYMTGTLWGSGGWANEVNTLGGVISTTNVYAEPGFVAPSAGDYHLAPGSAAIDTGVVSGAGRDIDGEPRPMGVGYDLGADEFMPLLPYTAYTPVLVAVHP